MVRKLDGLNVLLPRYFINLKITLQRKMYFYMGYKYGQLCDRITTDHDLMMVFLAYCECIK